MCESVCVCVRARVEHRALQPREREWSAAQLDPPSSAAAALLSRTLVKSASLLPPLSLHLQAMPVFPINVQPNEAAGLASRMMTPHSSMRAVSAIAAAVHGAGVASSGQQMTGSSQRVVGSRFMVPAAAPPPQCTAPASRPRGSWSKEEDSMLKNAVAQFGGKEWKKIALFLGGSRSGVQCLHRWNKVLKPGLVKGPWTSSEDAVLRQMVDEHGVGNVKWSVIASRLTGRIGKQCRERWFNHLDPTINKGPWNDLEDQVMFGAQETMGNRWCEIAKLLDGRTENMVKNRWNSSARRKWFANKGVPDPVEMKRAEDRRQKNAKRAAKGLPPLPVKPQRKSRGKGKKSGKGGRKKKSTAVSPWSSFGKGGAGGASAHPTMMSAVAASSWEDGDPMVGPIEPIHTATTPASTSKVPIVNATIIPKVVMLSAPPNASARAAASAAASAARARISVKTMLEPSGSALKVKSARGQTAASVASASATAAGSAGSTRPLTPGAQGRKFFQSGLAVPPSPAMRDAMSGFVHAKTPASGILSRSGGGFGRSAPQRTPGGGHVTFKTEISREPLKRGDGPLGSGEMNDPMSHEMLQELQTLTTLGQPSATESSEFV